MLRRQLHQGPATVDRIRYYGFYSNESRGLRAKGQGEPAPPAALNWAPAPSAKQARKRWAAQIKEVYEMDPWSVPSAAAR